MSLCYSKIVVLYLLIFFLLVSDDVNTDTYHCHDNGDTSLCYNIPLCYSIINTPLFYNNINIPLCYSNINTPLCKNNIDIALCYNNINTTLCDDNIDIPPF